MPKMWRTEVERSQTLGKHVGFNHLTTTNNTETAVVVSTALEEGVKVSLVVELNDLYVEFDADAASTSMIIRAGTGYSEENVYLGTRVSVRNVTAGQNGRIIGIIWGR